MECLLVAIFFIGLPLQENNVLAVFCFVEERKYQFLSYTFPIPSTIFFSAYIFNKILCRQFFYYFFLAPLPPPGI